MRRTKRLLTHISIQMGFWFTLGTAFHLLASPVMVQARHSQAPTMLAQVQSESDAAIAAVDSLGMTVADMDRAIAFYSQVLSFQKISDAEVLGSEYEKLQGLFGVRLRIVKMRLGDEIIELTEYLTPKGKPYPIDSRSNDHWFQHIAIVTNDMDKTYHRLRSFKIQHVSTAPQTLPAWNKAAAGIRAFYFRDPDGHYLETIYFPPKKGNPKWQTPTNRVFLGIDHTAIVISNTANSLKFYRDLLGLKVTGESTNYGIEQEHLNNVEGAKLHISGLRATSGPGIEFLDYLAPKDGKIMPAEAKSNDILHWQTTLVAKNLTAIYQRLRSAQVNFISPDIVKISNWNLEFSQGLLVRDPDGHPLRIMQP